MPLMSAAGQSSMNPSPAASMIGAVTRPSVMTVFVMVLRMPILWWSVRVRSDERDEDFALETE